MATPQLPLRLEGGFPGVIGIDITAWEDDLVRATTEVRDELLQPAGLVHGGVYASIAETITSFATYFAVQPGHNAMGLSNSTTFLRPITQGTIHTEAVVRRRGRTTWFWDVDITDDEGRLCALCRMTIAVREAS